MKFFFLFIASFLLCSTSFSQQIWILDNPHSNIRFEVGWEQISMRTGEFKSFEGTIETDSWDDLSTAKFNLKVDPNSIDVIADKLSEVLKGEKLLDAEKFPEIGYSSMEVKVTSDSTYLVKGMINIHGVKKEQEAVVWVRGHKKGRKGYVLGIEVSLVINRKDFGMEWGGPRLGETVKVVGNLLYQQRIKQE